MRLLDSETLEFKEFYQEDLTPDYAILSHTWGNDEVSFKDMLESRSVAETKAGFDKIKWCAKQACADEIGYIWVDTCCIDKSSSSELSEAINSMFRWYRNSEVCYAYLSDVLIEPGDQITDFTKNEISEGIEDQKADSDDPSSDSEDYEQEEIKSLAALHEDFEAVNNKGEPEFERSDPIWRERLLPSLKWRFKRRLTKARWLSSTPKKWVWIGSKDDDTLVELIESFTGIPKRVLLYGEFSDYSIAQRMSWAASRETTRVEDTAYCLMGLFEIHIPMLYGEGTRAFIRLQEEIMKQTNDMTIFYWTDPRGTYASYRGLLARQPFEFARCRAITWDPLETSPGPETTSLGIKLTDICLIPRLGPSKDSLAVFPGVRDNHTSSMLGIHLQKISPKQFARVDYNYNFQWEDGLENMETFRSSTVFVRQRPILADMSVSRLGGIYVNTYNLRSDELSEVKSSGDSGAREIGLYINNSEVSAVKPLIQFSLLLSDEQIILKLDTTKDMQRCLSVGNNEEMRIRQKSRGDDDEFSVWRFELVKNLGTKEEKTILGIRLSHRFLIDESVLDVKLSNIDRDLQMGLDRLTE